MAQAKTEVVKPLNEVSIKDINNSKQKIDKWLKDHTHQLVGIDLVASVLGTVPIIGNVMAAIDVVSDIFQIYEKGYQNADVFDWTTMGIDLIGVAPVPGTTAIRTSARPALFLVRQEVKRVGKAALGEAVITVISKHLNDQVAGNIEKFSKSGLAQLNSILANCGDTVQGATKEINGGITRVVTQGKVFTNAASNKTRAQQQAAGITKGLQNGDLVRAGKNLVYMTENWGKALLKTNVNNNAKVVSMLVPQHLKQPVLNVGATIAKVGVTANQKIRKLGNKAEPQTIGWLFEVLRLSAGRFRKRQSAQVKPSQTTQAKNGNNNNKIEKSRNEHPATNNANQCKNCKGGTSGTITFAMGTEFITHIDAAIHSLVPESLARSYISNLYQYDQSIFGSRWTTPFTSKIVRCSEYNPQNPTQNSELKGWEYIGIDGRPIKLPELKVGQSYYDEVETFTYTLVSDDIRAITYGTNESRHYQKYKNEYRLVSINRNNQFSVGFRYDHVIEEDSYLSDIIFKQDQNIFAHLALKLNQSKLVEEVWLVENGQLKRQLSAYVYNEQHDLIQAINEFGASYFYTYQHHLLTRYTDLTQRGMNLKWDGILPSSKAIEEWADDYCAASKLEWDENVRVTSVTDVDGNVTEHYYGITGYTYRIIYPDNLQEWFFRDAAKNITSHIATDGSETSYTYDERGNVLTTSQADGATSYFEYNDKDQLIGMVDAEQGRWFKEYDASGNLVKEIDPLKHETAYAYNAMGLVTSIQDAKGGSKSLKYDDQGNLISYIDCSGKETQWQYDERGRVKSVENALKQKVEYFYTELTTEKREPIIKGLPLNAFGQLEKIKHADGSIEQFVHDAEGRLLVHLDAKQQQTRYEYDAAGLITRRIDALNQTLKYQWDRLGRLKCLINENGASYEFFYDVVGRLLREIDFDGKETVYQYDEFNGRLTTSIEVASAYGQDLKDRAAPKDRIQQFIFDSMGRLEQRTAGYGHHGLKLEQQQTEEFAYDFMGRLLQAKNAESNLQWFYDAAGNVIKEHQQDYKSHKTAVWKHSYDEINDRVKTIRPDGQNIDWLTYGSGHVQSLIINGQDLVSFERDDLHREITRHYANGISQEQQYDLAGRLNSQIMLNEHDNGYQNQYKVQNQEKNNALQQTSQLIQRLYQYDKTGELTAIKDTRRGNIAYKYDPVGRLLEASSKLGKETFNFDPASNIIDRYNGDKIQNHQHKAEEHDYGYNRLVNNVVKEYLDQQYQYDAYGQLIRQKSSQGDLNLEWDVYGRMIKSRNSQYTAEYRYDALGRRIQKRSKHHHTGDEHNIIYGWDGDTLAYESTEQATKHYIYEKDSFVPMLQAVYQSPIELHQTPDWSDKPYSVHRDPLWKTTKQSKGFDDVWFYHCDHLGTPQEMSDHTGAIIWKAEYKAWGECKAEKAKSSFFENSEIISNNIRFQGQYFDLETGLHYNRYRYYSPYVGRYVSKDPIGLLGGFNTFVYVSDPNGWVDPYGLYGTRGKQNRMPSDKHMPTKQGYQRQHIIPYSLKDHEIFAKSGMNINGSSNLMYMPVCEGIDKNEKLGLHRGWTSEHAEYNRKVERKLDAIQARSRGQNWDYRKYQSEVLNLQRELRAGTKNGIYTCALPLKKK
ncbi:RHS repeat-associated core domain-containing protein [Acinetobacter johnsonii]|uniref:RHS repeat-associated core domain-containing protein n=1 Tax=Acinetobacter johnsonii TaxID=40214 RepID=UPI0021689A20|nr:RHS repeat-associated core domain-containing protein [Acinetobacter johnsonii]MCS3525956.1 RHS repeat-associated protein [Acinetobacter johnsonii]